MAIWYHWSIARRCAISSIRLPPWLFTRCDLPTRTADRDFGDVNGGATTLTSHDAQRVRVRREAEQVIIEAVHRTPIALRVTCRFALDSDGRCVKGRIEVQTEVPSRLAAVQFPAVALRLPLSGTGDDDNLLLPVCDGYVVHNPAKYTFDRGMSYPGGASMQFLAACDRTAGVYLASRDAEGYCKRLFVRSRRKSLVLGIDHLLPQSPLSCAGSCRTTSH